MTDDEPARPPADSDAAGLVRARMASAQRRIRRGLVRGAGDVLPERRHLRKDIIAGIPGAIASVPDGMAASVLAGVNPAHGLYASFVGPIAGGLTASTRLMLVTATSAAALAAGSAVSGYEGEERSAALILLTLLAGALMIVAALLRLSRYVRFVSYSVMLGFLTGIAVNIVLGQFPVMLGVDARGAVPLMKTWYALRHIGEADVAATLVGAGALAMLVLAGLTRLSVIGAVIALVVPTSVVAFAGLSTVALVEDGGAIPRGLPLPQLPDLSMFSLDLLSGAAAVAAILLIQGAGVAEAAPNPDGSRSSVRRDFSAQGIANLVTGLFGGQPVGGSVGQTAVNVTAGAASRWAGIWSGLWMGVILLAFSGIVGKVAMPTLAAVLIYAGIGAIRPREIVGVAHAGKVSSVAMAATFVAVLLLPVAQAVGVGVLASLLLQLNQEALDLRVVRLRRDGQGRLVETPPPATAKPGEPVVLQAYGSLFYAGARTLQRHLPTPVRGAGAEESAGSHGHRAPAVRGPVVILRLRGRTTLGATFLKVIGDYARILDEADGDLYLSGVDPKVVAMWSRDGTARKLAGIHLREATAVVGESTAGAVYAAQDLPGSRPDGTTDIHHVQPAEPDL